MSKYIKPFDEEFKKQSVKLLLQSGRPLKVVARPSGRCIRLLNFKKGKKHVVEPQEEVIRKFECKTFALQHVYSSYI